MNSSLLERTIRLHDESSYILYMQQFIYELQKNFLKLDARIYALPVTTTCIKLEECLYNKAVTLHKPQHENELWTSKECIMWYIEMTLRILTHVQTWQCGWYKWVAEYNPKTLCNKLLQNTVPTEDDKSHKSAVSSTSIAGMRPPIPPSTSASHTVHALGTAAVKGPKKQKLYHKKNKRNMSTLEIL